jgi:WD domain, G-beta repeat
VEPIIVTLAAAIGKEAATSMSLSLLRDIVGVQNEQLEALKEIRQDVKTMLGGPWRKAHLLIEEAAHTEAEHERRARLREARAALFDAHSLEPEATPRRATIGVDLAFVHGLLGESQDARRWALRAHQDQSNAVAAAVPVVMKSLNSRVSALKAPVDGDFWSLVDTSRKKDPMGTDRWLREKYERGEVSWRLPPADFMADVGRVVVPGEGVSQVMRAMSGRWGAEAANDHARRWAWEQFLQRREDPAVDFRPFLAHVAIAETTTAGGRELMRLHRMVHDVHEYRRACLALDPGTEVPDYELWVNLSQPRRARITWEPVPSASVEQELAWRGGDKVVSVAFSPDGRRLVAASGNIAYVLDSRDGRELARVNHNKMIGVIWSVAFSPDGTRIATASGDHTARVWSSENGRELLCVRHLSALGFVRAVAFSPGGQWLATAAGDHTVRIWDTHDGRQLLKVSHDKAAWSVAFSPDGTRIASTGEDDTTRVWDCREGRELLHLSPGGGTGVAFSPDGSFIATGGNPARVWDGQSGRELIRLDVAFDVVFSPDAASLATASGDTVCIVDIRNGSELARFEHDDFVSDVAFSPDGQRLATASNDMTARVWRVGRPR